MISKAEDVNFADLEGYTPLHWGARSKSLHIVQLLLDAGANMNYTNEYGDSPLHLAINWKKADMALAMVRKCTDIKNLDNVEHSWSYLPTIHHAVRANMIDVVKVLLSKGVDINLLEPHYGRVPLHFACSKAMYHTLLTGGADVTIKAGYYPLESNQLGYGGAFSHEIRDKICELSTGKNWSNTYLENHEKIKQVLLDEIHSTNPELFAEEEPSTPVDEPALTLSQKLCSPITDAPICHHMVDGCIDAVTSRAMKAISTFVATKNPLAAAEVVTGACAFGAIATGVAEVTSDLLGLNMGDTQ